MNLSSVMELLILQVSTTWISTSNLNFWLLLWTSPRSYWSHRETLWPKYSKDLNTDFFTLNLSTTSRKSISWSQTAAEKAVLSISWWDSNSMEERKIWRTFSFPLSKATKSHMKQERRREKFLTLSLVAIWQDSIPFLKQKNKSRKHEKIVCVVSALQSFHLFV